MTNIASHPEKFGLRTIKSHDVAGSCEFDEVVLWRRDSDGTYWIGHDTGCSCPEPFGGMGVDDLTQVKTKADVAQFARERWKASYVDETDIERGVAELMERVALEESL
jgi:hypothetical protein